MVAWIEPLSLQTWFVNVMSGSATYFAPIAIFAIIGLAAYLRMTGLTLGFMIFVFLLMFSGFVPASLLILVAIVGGLLVGILVSKIVK
jgi:hypothetical protein